MIETRKHQFFGFVVILLIIGFLQYFRKILNGHKFSKYGKFLYIITMMTFVSGIMFILYFTEMNNILSFLIGLFVATMSEHIAVLFLAIGNNFNVIAARIIQKYTGINLEEELTGKRGGEGEHEESALQQAAPQQAASQSEEKQNTNTSDTK